jgi:hypothetical protein
MTIDERIERLTGRHEALTRSIEFMHNDWQERWQAVAAARQQGTENIRALARVAEIHERRLSDLET